MIETINLLNGGTVATIAIVVYLVVWGIKQTSFNNKYLPIAAEVIGAVIGFSFALLQGDLNWVVGLADGLVAGAISVGGNELAKAVTEAFAKDGGGSNDATKK